MRGPAPSLVLVILGLCIAGGFSRAQEAQEQPIPAGTELQTESAFAEEIKQLDAAANKAARVSAFDAILAKATEQKRLPEPLVSILQNKKPEAAFNDLLEHLRDTSGARHEAFIVPLVLAANDPGESAKVAAAALRAYGKAAVPRLCEMLASEVAAERLAAAAVSGERVGGAAGVVQVIPKLVAALERSEPDLNGVAIRSLKRITLLDYETARQWKDWLGEKTASELLAEIADRESEARRKAEAARQRAEAELLAVLLERMRSDERDNPDALIIRLQGSEYLPVRLEAVKLLRELLPSKRDEAAQPIIAALGNTLNDIEETEEVRKLCAAALAECGKPAAAFPYIDRALAANGISADLRLELVKGLNDPLAAARLGELLKAEIDVVESRSSTVLDTLISQVRSVVAVKDESEQKTQILSELSRLLDLVAAKLGGELEAPARKRYLDLAVKTCDTLVFIARQRLVDVSGCTDALLNIALTENSAASAALTALRQSLDVPSARQSVLQKLTSEPVSARLGAQYARLISNGDDAMLIKLLGLYEAMAQAPEPLETLRKRLLDRASSTEAVQPTNPDSRKTMREALRALLAVLLQTREDHIALLKELLEADYGGNDALGYLMVLKSDRVAILTTAMQPMIEKKPVKLALLVGRLDHSLTQAERDTPEYKAFRASLNEAVRAAIADRIGKALSGAIDDELKQELTGLASGPLRDQFVPAAVEQLRKKPEPGDSREVVAEVLISNLRQAHPNKYDDLALKGLEKDAFVKALDDLNARLRNDGYALP
jgi:hypothetical protein